jgi:hypothetical protein
MEKMSRIKALLQGRKRYFTGIPCKRGHVAQRYVSSYLCVECSKLAEKRYIKNNREKRNETMRIYWRKRYANDPEFREEHKAKGAANRHKKKVGE